MRSFGLVTYNAYLDQHYWHIATREPSIFDFWFWPLRWVAAFIVSILPFLIVGIIAAHFHDLEIKKEEQEQERLSNAKKATNLYINTNGSAPTENRS